MGIVDWEQCTPGRPRSRWNRLEGTMRPNGDILLTRYTWELLGGPEHVLIFYSRRAETIGVKPINGKIKDVFTVEPKSNHGSHGARIVRAASLIEQFHIKLDATIRFWGARIDPDGILTLDLSTATRSSRKPNRAGAYCPARYSENCSDMRAFWPLVNSVQQASPE